MNKLFDGMVLMMIALVAVAVRQVIVFEDSIGIAQTSGAIGEDVAVDVTGVYEMPCDVADTVAVGDILYWDDTAKQVTTDDATGSNVRAGVSWSAKAGAVDEDIAVKIG